MLDRLDNCDWEEAFKYAVTPEEAAPGMAISIEGFTREDVAEIVAIVDGENDGDDWLGVFRLADGRFAALRAGCDYTGWGCQEGGNSDVAPSLEAIVQFGLKADERKRLGLETIVKTIDPKYRTIVAPGEFGEDLMP
jgi:hypothetical protein